MPVNPSGTADLNVQVNDFDDNPLAAQTVYAPQPVRVGLMSFASNYSLSGSFFGGATGDTRMERSRII